MDSFEHFGQLSSFSHSSAAVVGERSWSNEQMRIANYLPDMIQYIGMVLGQVQVHSVQEYKLSPYTDERLIEHRVIRTASSERVGIS